MGANSSIKHEPTSNWLAYFRYKDFKTSFKNLCRSNSLPSIYKSALIFLTKSRKLNLTELI